MRSAAMLLAGIVVSALAGIGLRANLLLPLLPRLDLGLDLAALLDLRACLQLRLVALLLLDPHFIDSLLAHLLALLSLLQRRRSLGATATIVANRSSLLAQQV